MNFNPFKGYKWDKNQFITSLVAYAAVDGMKRAYRTVQEVFAEEEPPRRSKRRSHAGVHRLRPVKAGAGQHAS